jgi:hypothetical protein
VTPEIADSCGEATAARALLGPSRQYRDGDDIMLAQQQERLNANERKKQKMHENDLSPSGFPRERSQSHPNNDYDP